MFPEGTEKGDIKAYIEEAVTELFAKGTGTYADIKGATLITAGALTWNFPTDVNKQFGQYKSIPIANGLKFTIGLANQGGTHYKVTQFYPEPPDDRLETVNPGDMHTAKDALGV